MSENLLEELINKKLAEKEKRGSSYARIPVVEIEEENAEKKEEAKRILNLSNSVLEDEVTATEAQKENQTQTADDEDFEEPLQESEQEEIESDKQEENVIDYNTTLKSDDVFHKQIILEKPNYDFIPNSDIQLDSEDNKKKKTKKARFRLKLCSIIYCVLLAVGSGWCIGNAIHLNNLNESISNTEYEISQVQYLIKISQLDSYKQVTDDEADIITTVIEVTPPALASPTEISPETNWFDRFCQWLTNLGG